MKIIITENQFKQLLKEDKIKENITENTGEGLTLYHGSNHEITRFSDNFIGGEKSIDANGPGIYFSDLKEDSASFGYIIYTVNMDVSKFVTDKGKKTLPKSTAIKLVKMREDWEMTAMDWSENPNIGLRMFIESIYEINENSKDILLSICYDYYRQRPKDFVRNCVKLGINGINTTNIWGDGRKNEHYIVYNPSIVSVQTVEKFNPEKNGYDLK